MLNKERPFTDDVSRPNFKPDSRGGMSNDSGMKEEYEKLYSEFVAKSIRFQKEKTAL